MFRSLEQPPALKRLIICCDGTWQSSVSGEENIPSNVTRLTRNLASAGLGADGKVWQQVVYYDSGIGTGELTIAAKVVQGGVGRGLEINVLEAYNFLVMNYNPGDEIFCFGFSRGAYTARAIAGLVTDVGICKPESLPEFPKLYKMYKLHTDGTPFTESVHYRHFTRGMPDMEKTMRHIRQNKNLKLDLKNGENVIWNIPENQDGIYSNSRILKVVGVWDTVGALGVPDIHGFDMSWLGYHPNFHNVRTSPCKSELPTSDSYGLTATL
jgi:uncharacterized protein (DUF2235 family)